MGLGRISRYELVELLGHGGWGFVFRAWDTELQRDVALKVPKAGHGSLRREAVVEARVPHENIATCYDDGEAPLQDPALAKLLGYEPGAVSSVSYLTMEYVPGESLDHRLAHGQRMSPREALGIALQLANGLEAAHKRGVVHRDLKPGNIRVTAEGKVKILDFGLAHLPQGRAAGDDVPTERLFTPSVAVAGTPPYMAPEQARGTGDDPRSDLFSLGVILYELITGHRPFEGKSIVAVQDSIVAGPPPPLERYAANTPRRLEDLVRKLLAPSPRDRYQTARGVAVDLERILSELAGKSPPRHIPWWIRVLGAAAVAVLAVALLSPIFQKLVPRPPAASTTSLAVLPFRNLGGTGREAIAEGLGTAIVTELAQIPGLNVVCPPANSSPEGKPIQGIAKDLGVGSVLEGVVQWMGDRFQLDARLVEGKTGRIVWSERIPGDSSDLFRVQHQVAQRVADALSVRLSAASRERLENRPTDSLDAFQLYVRAKGQLERANDPAAVPQAVALLTRALQLDPTFALAHATLSAALREQYAQSKNAETLQRAEQAAQRALQLDPDLLDGRVALAWVYDLTGRSALAEQELRKVLASNPERDDAHFQLASLYGKAGDLEASEAELKSAVRIRPHFWRTWNLLGDVYKKRGRYVDARNAFERAIELAPAGVTWPYENLAAIEQLQGNHDRAMAVYERIPAEYMSAVLASNIGANYDNAGRMDRAERYYRWAIELDGTQPIFHWNLGDLCLQRGDSTAANAEYEQALKLVDTQLRDHPGDSFLLLQHLIYLAKSGRCAAAAAGLNELRPSLTMSADVAFMIAVVHGACREHERALEAIAQALQEGFSRQELRKNVTFRFLAQDPRFQALTGAEAGDARPSGAPGR